MSSSGPGSGGPSTSQQTAMGQMGQPVVTSSVSVQGSVHGNVNVHGHVDVPTQMVVTQNSTGSTASGGGSSSNEVMVDSPSNPQLNQTQSSVTQWWEWKCKFQLKKIQNYER